MQWPQPLQELKCRTKCNLFTLLTSMELSMDYKNMFSRNLFLHILACPDWSSTSFHAPWGSDSMSKALLAQYCGMQGRTHAPLAWGTWWKHVDHQPIAWFQSTWMKDVSMTNPALFAKLSCRSWSIVDKHLSSWLMSRKSQENWKTHTKIYESIRP